MKRILLALVLALLPLGALAHQFMAGPLTIRHPYSYATAQSVAVAAGFMKIENANKEEGDRLIAASSPAAGKVEIHTMGMDEKGVMKMRKLDSLEIPAGGALLLAPQGNHLMLLDIRKAFTLNEKIPLTLTFEKAGEVTVELKVEAPGTQHDYKDSEHQEDMPMDHDMPGHEASTTNHGDTMQHGDDAVHGGH